MSNWNTALSQLGFIMKCSMEGCLGFMFTSLGSLCSFRCMLLFGVRISRIYAPFTVGVSKQDFYVFISKLGQLGCAFVVESELTVDPLRAPGLGVG